MQFCRYCSQLMCPYLQWMDVKITQYWVKQTAPKDTQWSTPAIIDAIGMSWYQVGIVSKELPEIGWRTNVFPYVTAVLTIQVGLMAHTRQLLKVWSLVESVTVTVIISGTGQETAVAGVTILESGTVELSSCMSYKTRLFAIFVTVVTAAQVIYFVCFFECVSQQSVIKQSSPSIIKQSLKTFSRGDSMPS